MAGTAGLMGFATFLETLGLRGLGGRPPRKGHEMDIDTSAKAYPVSFTDAEWRKRLTAEQYQVLRHHGTERPGSCALLREKRPGTFACAGCANPLFEGGTKFESGTGWPSFDVPLEGAVETTEDRSMGMLRTEVHCSRCGGHLGHVFPDGPPPTYKRYCMNGVALTFSPAES
jgi:peptide-methionine (R)-S-oxide reductase